jgi:hypothetical protein
MLLKCVGGDSKSTIQKDSLLNALLKIAGCNQIQPINAERKDLFCFFWGIFMFWEFDLAGKHPENSD